MALLPSTTYPNNSRVVSGVTSLFKDDVSILCNTTSVATSMTLLEIPDNYWSTAWRMYISDNSSNASANNIVISAGVGQTINGAASITINSNDGCVEISIIGNNKFLAKYTYGGSVASPPLSAQINGGNNNTLTCVVVGGSAGPFNYAWTLAQDNALPGGGSGTQSAVTPSASVTDITWGIVQESAYLWRCKVTDTLTGEIVYAYYMHVFVAS